MSTNFLRWLVILVILVAILAIAAWIFPAFRELLGFAALVVIGFLVFLNWASS